MQQATNQSKADEEEDIGWGLDEGDVTFFFSSRKESLERKYEVKKKKKLEKQAYWQLAKP